MAILTELTSDEVLDTAYDWLCRRRRDYPADADMWSFRQVWAREKGKLKAALAAGRFRIGLLTRVTLKDGEEIDHWSARDALVLKALAIVLAKHLPVSELLHPGLPFMLPFQLSGRFIREIPAQCTSTFTATRWVPVIDDGSGRPYRRGEEVPRRGRAQKTTGSR